MLRKFIALALVLAFSAVFPVLPLLAAENDQGSIKVRWEEASGLERDQYVFGQHETDSVPIAGASVDFGAAGQQYVVGNAVPVTVRLYRSSGGLKDTYSVEVAGDDGVKFVPIAPVVVTYLFDEKPVFPAPDEVIETGGFRDRFTMAPPKAAGEALSFTLAAGEDTLALDAYYAAEFHAPGNHEFVIKICKNGQPVKTQTVSIQAGAGKGSWRSEVEYPPVGVSLLAGGARDASEARAVLNSFIKDARVTFRATGDLAFQPAGTFSLPLDCSPVWSKLVPQKDMSEGEAEVRIVMDYNGRSHRPGQEWGYKLAGQLKPQVNVTNASPFAGTSGTRGSLPYVTAALAAALLAGWVLSRSVVDAWLELEQESNRVAVRRGRRGPRRVKGILDVDGSRQEIWLAKNESREVELLPEWQAVKLTVPQKWNRGKPITVSRGEDRVF